MLQEKYDNGTVETIALCKQFYNYFDHILARPSDLAPLASRQKSSKHSSSAISTTTPPTLLTLLTFMGWPACFVFALD
jgi:hypothetical protein